MEILQYYVEELYDRKSFFVAAVSEFRIVESRFTFQ